MTNDETQQRIRQRAYELWQQAGCPRDRANEFWEQAELEEQDRIVHEQPPPEHCQDFGEIPEDDPPHPKAHGA